MVRNEEVCRRLKSAPGAGPIAALAFRATIDRPERFGSSQAVGMLIPRDVAPDVAPSFREIAAP
ncbi:transposase [Mesorhizobium sp. M0814]|uniref:transposase n=1 Tax=Mesorhizobium sp. M0814 TaxID=2957004 RepID=UPI0033389C17